MAFELARLDEGVAVGSRVWNPFDVVASDLSISLTNADPFMIELWRDDMGPNARAFDMIDRTQVASGALAALLQFCLRTVELIVAEHTSEKRDASERLPYPIRMFLETVVQSEASARATAGPGDVDVREGVLNAFYGIDADTLASTARPARTADESPLLSDCAGRAALAYRLWIIADKRVDFPMQMENVLKLAIEEYKKRTTATTLAIDNRQLREYRKQTGSDPTATFQMTKLLGRDELWATIDSRSAMLNALAVYTGANVLLNQNVRADVFSAPESMGRSGNPAYFGAVFSAARHFLTTDPRCDQRQADWRNYVGPATRGRDSGELRLTFPCNVRVLNVPHELHNRSFIERYTPDYQRQTAQRRLLHADLRAAQQRIVAPPPRPAPSLASTIARRAGLAVSQSDDDDNFSLAGGFGDARQAAVMAAAEDASRTLTRAESSWTESSRAAVELYLARQSIAQRFARSATETPAERASINALVLETTRFVDPRVNEQRAAIEMSLSGNVAQTTMRVIAQHYATERAAIAALPSLRERCIEHTLMQKAALHDYRMSCTNPLADVSTIGGAINAFMMRADVLRQNYFRPTKFFDPQLSVFGHMMVRELAVQDKVYSTHSVHALQLAMIVALFDAYRVSHSLHFNVLVSGPPELGKSRGLEHVEARAIPGTVLSTTRCTQNAFSSDVSSNDVCHAFHEAPPALLRDATDSASSGAQSSSRVNGAATDDQKQHEVFKSKLTAMVVRTQELRRQPDGSFKQETRVSEQIMTYLMCTNMSLALVASAIQSRFFCFELASFRRRDATINDKGLDEHHMSREVRALRDRSDWEFRLLQALYYHTEKLISVGALTPPTLTTFMIFSPIFERVLSEEFSIRVSARSLIQMELLVRHLVIRRAIYMLYSAPTAPFAGRTVAVEHLVRIDPWLHDDPEIVFFAFEFMRSHFIDPNIAIVSRALRAHIATQCATPAIFERCHISHRVKPRGEAIRQAVPPAVSRTTVFGSVVAAEQATLDGAQWATVDAEDPAFDFSRVLLHTRYTTLALALESIIARTETIRLTRTQIERTLVAMAKKTVNDHPYEPDNTFGGEINDSAFPVRPIKSRPRTDSLAIELHTSSNIVLVHVSVIGDRLRDPIEKVIHECCDANMPRVKMLRGSPHEADLPQLYGVRYTQPTSGKFHVVADRSALPPSSLCVLGQQQEHSGAESPSATASPQNDATRRRAIVLTTVSAAEYAATQRMADLNMPREAALGFSFGHIEQNIAANQQNYVSLAAQIDYPSDVGVVESLTDHLTSVQTVFAGLDRDQAAATMSDRVTLIEGENPEVAQSAEIAAWLQSMGMDPRVSSRALQRWLDDSRRAQEECATRNKESVERAMAVARKMKAAEDSARAQFEAKRARRAQADDDAAFVRGDLPRF